MITFSIFLGIIGLLALWQVCRSEATPEAALVHQTEAGNWCVIFPDGPTVGEFSTPEDASRLARRNGYEPIVSDKKGADDEAE